jgi:iron complex transport system substrate-binding protein
MRKLFLAIVFIIFIAESYSFSAENLRIISLAPSTTEILFALGLDEEIVGVSKFCNYPPKALSKEKVGTFSQPNIEKILSLKPDIIFCTGLEQASLAENLKKLKLNVIVSDPSNISSLLASIAEIGKLTNKESQAGVLIVHMQESINETKLLVKKIPKEKKQKVFIEIWHNPLSTASKGSFINELIELAGGDNIAYDLKSAYGSFSPELVIKRNPDCIILAYMGKDNSGEELRARAGWGKITAVKNNRVYGDIDPDILLRPGPRITEGLREIYKKLYESSISLGGYKDATKKGWVNHNPSRMAGKKSNKEGLGEPRPSKSILY